MHVIVLVTQVGSHVLKDALGSFVVDPLKDQAVGGALQATGMQGTAQQVGHLMDSSLPIVKQVQWIMTQFYH